MVRSLRVLRSQFPGPVPEDEHEKEEEDADDFKENDSPDAAKWPEKSANSFGHTAAYNSGRPDCLADAGVSRSRPHRDRT